MSPAATGHLAMIGFAIAVSGSFSLGGLAAPHLDPAALNAVRFSLAAAIMGVVTHMGGGLSLAPLWAAPWRYPILGGLMAIYMVTMFEALAITSPVSTNAVFTLAPILSAILGWLLLRQVTTTGQAGALAIGGAGALWVIFRGDVTAFAAFEVGLGERIFFVGVAAHALYAPMVRLLNRGEPVALFTFGTIASSALLLLIWSAAELARVNWATLPLIVWLTIAYTAVVATAGSFFLLQIAALRLNAGKVMAYTYLTPVIVIFWEAGLGHGWPGAAIWIGVSAAALCLALLAWR